MEIDMNVMKKELTFEDRQIVVDRFSNGSVSDKPILGKVQIFERKVGDTKLYLLSDISNLVVYRGRRWLIQRAFDKNYDEVYPYKDLFISWFAIGTGGAPSGHPLTPTSPSLKDTALSSHGVIESGMNYVTVGGKEYHKFDSGYPEFTLDDDISSIGLSSPNDRRIIAKIVTTLTADEANNDSGIPDPDSYQEINEAGLFFADRNTISPVPTKVEMFARVTFPTMRKDNQVELVFNWYVFF